MNNDEYIIKELSFDTMIDELNNASPLQISKKLIEYELYDQQDSIEVLNKIYKEFEGNQDIIDELVTPVFLNIADGLIKHPKLGLKETGITVSRLVNEIKGFSYDTISTTQRDIIQDKANLDKNTNIHIDDKGIYDRKDMDNNRKSSIAKEKFNNNRTMYSELEVNENGAKKDYIYIKMMKLYKKEEMLVKKQLI